jgi:hypothetical protein
VNDPDAHPNTKPAFAGFAFYASIHPDKFPFEAAMFSSCISDADQARAYEKQSVSG